MVQHELRSLNLAAQEAQPGLWAGNRVVRMTNGDYLIYAFWHGMNMGFVDHLFLAHGSDGRWYYSSYHFCQQLTTIRFYPRPLSIADFASKYSLREFDGKSDICLQPTYTWSGTDETTEPPPPAP